MQVSIEERACALPRTLPDAASAPRMRRRGHVVVEVPPSYEGSTPRLQASVRNAYSMAVLLQVDHPVRVRTAVLQDDGTLLAVAALLGMEPAKLMRDMLLPLGFREVQPTPEQSDSGYDMVLQLSTDASQTRALHSGGAPVLWPPGP